MIYICTDANGTRSEVELSAEEVAAHIAAGAHLIVKPNTDVPDHTRWLEDNAERLRRSFGDDADHEVYGFPVAAKPVGDPEVDEPSDVESVD